MKRSSSTKRVPRKVGLDDDEDASNATDSGPVINRPVFKARKSSSLRTSFGPSTSGQVDDDDESAQASVVTPKRTTLSKIAVQRNASKRASLLTSRVPLRQTEDDDRPDYSPASLQELKDSTPSTPTGEPSDHAHNDLALATQGERALDLSAKFGSSLARYEQSAIPTATEIAEKKARRARLALESQEFISLDPDDPYLDGKEAEDEDDNVTRDERGNLILKPLSADKWGLSETRMARGDDEDLMEGFDEFTDDGRIALSRKAEFEAAARRKQELSEQIAAAEEARSEDEDSDDSERARITAYEAAQTRHGTYTETARDDATADTRPRTPPIITPLPTLDGVLARLRAQLAEMQTAQTRSLTEMEALRREKVHLAEEEVRIQNALKETSEKFATLRKEKGIPPAGLHQKTIEASAAASGPDTDAMTENGDLTRKADATLQTMNASEEEEEDDEEPSGFVGLGFGGARHGFGASGMLPMPLRQPESDEDSDAD